jgi:Fatty acid hydroxylase superfamily
MTDTRKKLLIYFADPAIPVMATLAVAGLSLAVLRRAPIVPMLIAVGWSLYVVQEHLIHRFIFHAPAPRNQALFDLLYRLHYGHHDQVKNRHLLFTPLWFSLPMTAMNVALVAIVFPLYEAVIAVLGGGVVAYLVFEWLHLTSHFRTSSNGRLGKYITRRHGKHHHIDYANWYTVSPGGQLVDRALGADPVLEWLPASAGRTQHVVSNVRTCGLDPEDPRLIASRARFGSDATLANKPVALGGLRLEQAS